ncbi:MAG: recombinase family protein [Victivallales bacterium]|nr:recombinase family protein [Victivallales bacterium]
MSRKKAVIYARQSSGKEEESESIALQLERCRALAKEQDIEILGEFYDANSSGRLYPAGADAIMEMDIAYQKWRKNNTIEKRSRPGLKSVLDLLPKVNMLLVYDITRLYRPIQNGFLQGYIDMMLIEHRVHVLTVKEGESNPSDFSDSLVTTIKSHVNDNQIRLTIEKSKLALTKLRDSGYLPTGTRMYGINYIGGKERKVEVIPEQAEVIRFVFDNVVRHKPYNWILREMNRLYGERVSGKAFYSTSFRHIITQPFYCGYMFDSHGALIEAKQMKGQEIIPFDIWQKANDILNNKQRPPQHRKIQSRPFSGLLVCGHCGAKMVVGQDGDKEYYHCMATIGTDDVKCRQSRVTMNLVRQSEHYTGLRHAIAPLLVLSLFSSLERQATFLTKAKELDKLRASIDNYQRRLNEAAQAYIEGKLDLVAFSIVQEKANSRIKSLKADVLQIEMASQSTKTCEENLQKLLLNIDNLMNDRLDDHDFEDMLWESIKCIKCFYDYVVIDTIYGKLKLNRYMDRNKRNFPKFTYEIIYPSQQDSCLDAKIHVTYIYGNGTPRKLVAELGNLVIFSMG